MTAGLEPEKVEAYERDPYLESMPVEVVEAGSEHSRPFVLLADTLFYPEGGGQPCDHGAIGTARVIDVQKVKGARGVEIRHYLDSPLQPGRHDAKLDAARRFDLMQQHTAQHMLSAIALDRWGWATTAFHLGPERTDIELSEPRLPEDELTRLEEAVATEVRAARRVRARRIPKGQLATTPGVRTRRLPEGHEGSIRLVEIEGLDLNTCGGTHVANTCEVESLKLLDTEPMRGGTRLYFIAGGRVRARLAAHERRLAEMKGLLGTGEHEFVELLRAKLELSKETERRCRSLELELAELTVSALLAAEAPLVEAHWPERGPEFLQAIAKRWSAWPTASIGFFTAGVDGGGFVVVAGARFAGDLIALGRAAAEALGAKGGGRERVFQGKAGSWSLRATAVARLRG